MFPLYKVNWGFFSFAFVPNLNAPVVAVTSISIVAFGPTVSIVTEFGPSGNQ